MRIKLSEHFTYLKLLKFTAPSVIMLIFTSIYGVIDGLFVSNYVGKTSFAAINLIMPILLILGALGFMIGTGGTAIVAKTMGEGKPVEANRYFTMLVITAGVGGIILALIGELALPEVARLLGAEGEMFSHSVEYGKIILCSLPFLCFRICFRAFL